MLRRVYTVVCQTLEAQSVARNMYQNVAITPKQLQSIQNKQGEPIQAAEELLSIVMNGSGNVFSCFLDALKQTDQQATHDIIVSSSDKGKYSITCPLHVLL